MCGIFGFILNKPLSMKQVFAVLKKLEVSKYPDEEFPVGGYGAGIAIMFADGDVRIEKVGKTADSPAGQLEEIVKNACIMNAQLSNAKVLLGHVRNPSPGNMGTAKFKEAAQPFVGHFEQQLTVVSVHNGTVENWKDLRADLKEHVFESEKAGSFIDSEVIPHYFGEILLEQEDVDGAAYELLDTLEGSNAEALLQIDEENAFLHLIYKGKPRGLTVWANNKGEVIFCSRPEPVEKELESLLLSRKFKEKISISHQEDAGLKLTFRVPT